MSQKKYIPVSNVMSRNIHTIDPLETVANTIHRMREHHVSSLVVERRDEHDEYGLIVVADIARKVIAEDRSVDRINVYEIMTKPVITLPSEMDIKYAIRLLTNFSLSRALVIDHDRKPIGIVTLRDMVLHNPDLETS